MRLGSIERRSSVERLLGQLPPMLGDLARQGIIRRFPGSSILMQEGEVGDSTWILLRGRVRIYAQESNGRELTYGYVEPGDYFAEMWLDGGPRSASAITVEDTVCSVVPAEAVRAHFHAYPEFALALVARVIRRARAATKAARNLALLDVYSRLVVALEQPPEGATAPPPSIPVTLRPLTHQDLAYRVGASREMVSRLLKDLERGGYVALAPRQITLLRKLPARW